MEFSALVPEASGEAIPVSAVRAGDLDRALAALDERQRRLASAQGFKAEAGRHILLPDADGNIGRVLFGLGAPIRPDAEPLLFGKLATALPKGTYRLAEGVERPDLAALAFVLASYRFDRYRKPKKDGAAARRADMAPTARRLPASATRSS